MSDTKASRAPLVHVVQRTSVSFSRQAMCRVLAIIFALLTISVFLLCMGYNPLEVFSTMITGSLGTSVALKDTVKYAIPLCITALGVTLAFRMKFWNVGAEGQICVGAIAGSFFAYTYGDVWPQWLLITVMIIVGFLAGGLWGMIPAYFKTKWGTNETLFTLMLNYVASYFIQYLKEGPWRDPSSMGFPIMPRFSKAARMPMVLGVHIGWIFALVLVVLVFLYIRYSKQGYELTVVGENEQTARYAGMPVKKIILRTMFLSAGICGLAGILQASGADKQLTETVAGGNGFTAITIAWLARLSPIAILLVSFLFGVMEKGSGAVETAIKLSPSMADVMQGIILFFMLGAEFFINYKLMFRNEKEATKE
jgi:general nucleoside transport system permease protein